MNITLQRILHILAAIVLGFLLYVLPDMVANLGETWSIRLKGVAAVFLLLASIVLEHKKKGSVATFTLTAGIVLMLLLFFGGAIRMAELN